MNKYFLLIFMLGAFVFAGLLAHQIQGGLIFSGNEKMIVKKDSILRKILLTKKNRDYPLKIYKVIPLVITSILFLVVVLLYMLHIVFFASPVGIAIGSFLESKTAIWLGLIWLLSVGIYIGIINAI